MEELLELRGYILNKQYNDALLLVDDMTEMAKEDKYHRITSYMIVLLVHIIKQKAENRSTRSWENSISFALFEINETNERDKSGGVYAKEDKLNELLEKAFIMALKRASIEAFEGVYSARELLKMINEDKIKEEALQLIIRYNPKDID